MGKKVHLEKGFDRLSNLPEAISAHILSFLPTRDAVRTSILSSNWRTIWTQVPSLDVRWCTLPFLDVVSKDEKKTLPKKRRKLYDFLDIAFASIMNLEKVNLYVPHLGSKLKSRVDNWLDRAFGHHPLVEFKLDLEYMWKQSWYILPKTVLSSKSITKLTLVNCQMDESSLSDVNLPSLCYLSLIWVKSNEQALGSLLANCPNLEDFSFVTCRCFKRVEISGLPKLKKVVIKYDRFNKYVIDIRAPSLLELTYQYASVFDKEGVCKIEFIDCENMKRFKAIGTALDDIGLHSLLDNFPALERLELDHCNRLRHIEISNPDLVYLKFMNCQRLRNAEVNAPNLKYFHYQGVNPIRLPLRGITPRLKEAIIYLSPCKRRGKWYDRLVKFLAKLRHCERLTLSVLLKEVLIIPEEVRNNTRPPLSGVKHLIVSLGSIVKERISVDFVEGLLWLAPCLETISISNSTSKVCKRLELKYETPLEQQKNCGCWKSLRINCYRHYLNKVSVENKTETKDDVKLSDFFRNARIDGKLVEYSCKNSLPEK